MNRDMADVAIFEQLIEKLPQVMLVEAADAVPALRRAIERIRADHPNGMSGGALADEGSSTT